MVDQTPSLELYHRNMFRPWDRLDVVSDVTNVIHSMQHRCSNCFMAVQKNRSSNECKSGKKCWLQSGL